LHLQLCASSSVLRKENSLIYEEQNFPTRGIHPTDLVRYYILYPTELVSE